ncbi:MAG: hypothetical protein ACLP4V_16705 [Methylocella sp.]
MWRFWRLVVGLIYRRVIFKPARAALGFAVVRLGHHVPVCADASPFLDKQDTAEKIGLHVEPIEPAHVPRRIDAAKIRSGHGSSLEIVQRLTL